MRAIRSEKMIASKWWRKCAHGAVGKARDKTVMTLGNFSGPSDLAPSPTCVPVLADGSACASCEVGSANASGPLDRCWRACTAEPRWLVRACDGLEVHATLACH